MNGTRNETSKMGGRVRADSMALKLDGRTPNGHVPKENSTMGREHTALTHVAGHFSASPPPPPSLSLSVSLLVYQVGLYRQ